MKKLIDYIKENNSTIEQNIEKYAWGIIDEFNQEGVYGWEEDDIISIVNGDKEPNFEYVVNAMIDELEEYGDKDRILSVLKKYNTNQWKESIETAILRAMQDYVKNII